MAGVLSRLPGIIDRALTSAGIVESAQLTRLGDKVSDGRGGQTPSGRADFDCRAKVLDYTDAQRSFSSGAILEKDRLAIVTALSLSITPKADDLLFAEAARWRVIRVKRDLASAAWELQLRPAALLSGDAGTPQDEITWDDGSVMSWD